MSYIEIFQVKSTIKRLKGQKKTLEALGLRGISKTVIQKQTPSILGMIKKVEHLVEVKPIETKKK